MISRGFLLSLVISCGANLLAQSTFPPFEVKQTHHIAVHEALSALDVEGALKNAGKSGSAGSGAGLPMWTYATLGFQDGKVYQGRMVGQNPLLSEGTTTVPVALVPVVFKITQGGSTYVFDPDAADAGCIGPGNTAYSLTLSSPLFQNTKFTFNKTNLGNTQYADAFLRGEFWLLAQLTNYHLKLTPRTATPLVITIDAGAQGNAHATIYGTGEQCGNNTNGVNFPGALAVVDINSFDSALQTYVQANGLNAGEFPFFIAYNSVLSEGSANDLNNCCVLGYHNALNSGQTYGFAEFEGRNQTVFSGVADVAAASHEINEWVNDPTVANPTPPWGDVGQDAGGCQANLEVGDPLTGTLMPTITLNGFNYHLQELAYFSWFYGGPALGAGGVYSSNGTFKGPAKLCPPGGTN